MNVPRKAPARLGAHPAAKIARRLVVWAVLLALTFALVHALGFRAYTSILSGTGSCNDRETLCGLAYLTLYAVFVILVPVLLLAAGLLALTAWTIVVTRPPVYHRIGRWNHEGRTTPCADHPRSSGNGGQARHPGNPSDG